VLKTVSAPQGNPLGRGLLVRKPVKSGATRVPRAEFLFVFVCGNDAVMAEIVLKTAKARPMLIDFPAKLEVI
jgi:hypothetical protein